MKHINVKTKKGIEFEIIDMRKHLKIADDVYLASGTTKQDILVACGIDDSKVDYALPQNWVNDYMEKHNNQYPIACWSYHENRVFGEPLFFGDLIKTLWDEIKEQL